MTRSHKRTFTALALVASLALVAVATQGLIAGLACAAPLLLLALPLLFDGGERRIAQLGEALGRSRARRTRVAPRRRVARHSPRPAGSRPRGGLLIAFSLAVRPPPAAAPTG